MKLVPSELSLRIGLCLVAIWVVFAAIAYETRGHAWKDAADFEAGVASLVEKTIAREFESYDLSIRTAVADSTDAAVLALPPSLRRKTIFDASSEASGLGRLLVLDRSGRVFASSKEDAPPGLDLSDREYFKVHQANPDAGLYVGLPFEGRITHEWSLGLSRRRTARDGTFDGVVVGTIKLSFFEELFAAVRLPPGSSVSLITGDGTILTRLPHLLDYVGVRSPLGGVATQTAIASGGYRHVSPIDGVDRLFALRQVGDLPIYVNVGLATDHILAMWRGETIVIGAGFAILSAIIVLLGVNLGGELRRRGEAERRLADLASTDYLTLIANRRRFDEVLGGEWHRCARAASPLSLLMVDVDLFKSFNDTYGHLRGDDVLRTIADALRTCVERPGDLVARFGGEEFAVLLPATDGDGAFVVATAIRAAVDLLDVDHAVSPHGRVTVSIGVATRVPEATRAAKGLVEAADAALYVAKREGRNHVVRDGRAPCPNNDAVRRVA